MLNILNRLFGRKVTPSSFDMEKAVGHYLLTLPRCTNRILVVGNTYQDERFNYELTIDAASLSAWVTKHETEVLRSNEPEQAARKALSLWLNGADLTDNFGSILPLSFYKILRNSHEIFMLMDGAQLYCHECRQLIEHVTKKNVGLPPKEKTACWRSEWHCHQGYLLYKEA